MREKSGSPTASTPVVKPQPAQEAAIDETKEKRVPRVERRTRPRPRRSVEESRNELKAMRELANLSAQSAITSYTQRSLRQSVFSKAAVSLVALVCAGTLMLWADGINTLTFYSGLFALGVALIWGFQYAMNIGTLASSNKSSKQKLAQDPSDEDDASEQDSDD